MKASENLVRYVKIHTTSSENSSTFPSSSIQLNLAKILTTELKNLGIANAHTDEFGYVYASVPATPGHENAPALGFIAHMDTSPAFSGENVNPQFHKNYDGGNIVLPKNNRIISTKDFPEIANWKGRTVITADGSTLLGADDKAGIAEIMSAIETLLKNGTPHGKICIAFTPDEEIGAGTDHFDVKKFGADFAFTIDGHLEGDINYENFNAASADIKITGVSVHPGDAKNVLVNAILIASEINAQLPGNERPETTEGYEGFYFMNAIKGDAAYAEVHYIIRDHDSAKFTERKTKIQNAVKVVSEKYPTAKIEITVKDSYFNMAEKIADCMHLIENARRAAEVAGTQPKTSPIRGGTDGARLSYMGLPCPNLGTGGMNFHGPYECISEEGMEIVVKMILSLIDTYKNPL